MPENKIYNRLKSKPSYTDRKSRMWKINQTKELEKRSMIRSFFSALSCAGRARGSVSERERGGGGAL